MLALAEALGQGCERKRLRPLERFVLGKPRLRPGLHHLDLARSDPLAPPWPDLVITMGQRPSMAALWIRRQAGGRTRIAVLGKPSGPARDYDLVVAGPEVQLPALPQVLRVGLPLLPAREDLVAAAAQHWRARLSDLARPLVALLIGGPTQPYVFDSRVLAQLLRLARDVADRGGTPFVTTSRRTPADFAGAVAAALPPQAQLFRWSPEAGDNPYLALLGLADGFIVTGDSISMQVEVVRQRRPLAILPLPTRALGTLDRRRRALSRWFFAAPGGGAGSRLRAAAGRALYRARLLPATRDFDAFQRGLVAGGLAVWAGQPLEAPRSAPPEDLPRVVERVRSLLESR